MNESHEGTKRFERNAVGRGEIDLRRYLQVLLDNKRLFARFAGGAAILFVLVVLLFSFTFPKERISKVQFRFLFNGAEEGKYPNGDLFSPMELIAAPNLKEVYDANELNGVIPFPKFKNRFTIIQQNPERDALENDYMGRMADTKMSSVERDRLLREFRAKQAALRSSEYRLFYLERSTAAAVPPLKMQKVLNDIVSTWARNADQRKGAMTYRTPILSPRMVNQQIAQVGGDPVVALDILRNQILKIISNIEQLDGLPGAAFIRDEKEQDSLEDVRNRLQELIRYFINPMIGEVRTQRISSNPAASINYLESQLFQLSLQKKAAQDGVKLLEDSLRSFLQQRGGASAPASARAAAPLTMIPMVSSDFFQEIMAIGQEASDLEFRKNITERIIAASNELVVIERDTRYYEEFLSLYRNRIVESKTSPEKIKNFESRYNSVAMIVVDSLQKINQIYERISKYNLNPDSLLYALESPATSAVRSVFSMKTLALLFLLYGFLAFVLGGALLYWKANFGKSQ